MLLELPASTPARPCEITNRNHPVELARLVTKTPVLLRALDGLLPGLACQQVQQVRRVLDIGCGPGVWSLQLARSYPAVEVIGIDTSLLMISYATRIAIGQEIQNVLYQEITSLSEPLPFENGAFDLINAPFLGTRLRAANWPHLLAECHRLLRPGGRLCLTEEGIGRSNASAHEQLIQLWARAMQGAGYHFAMLGRDRDLPGELKALLAAAGFREQSTLTQVIDYSYGTDLHEAWIQDRLIFMKEVQPFLLAMNVVTQEHLDRLYEQFRGELRLACFQAIQPLMTVWAMV